MIKLKIVTTFTNFIGNIGHYYCARIIRNKIIHNFVSNSDKKVKDESKVSFLIIDKQSISFHLFLFC